MNIHPIFVHFPIALLTLYGILEIFPLSRWYPQAPWTSIKTFLSVFGSLASLAAIFTGGIAEGLITDPGVRKILRVHETFAYATASIFGLLALAYCIRWIAETHQRVSFLRRAADFVLTRGIAIPLAVLGLIAITITGALGGAIVFGPDVDPVAKFVYSLFF